MQTVVRLVVRLVVRGVNSSPVMKGSCSNGKDHGCLSQSLLLLPTRLPVIFSTTS